MGGAAENLRLPPSTGTAPYTDPVTVQEALSRPDADHWRAALQKESQSMIDRGVFKSVPRSSLPADARILQSKVVWKLKRTSTGEILKYKARIVAKGCSQQPGKDFSETFAPTGDFAALRLMISLALSHGWPLHQLDIETAYLYAALEEELYMSQPVGFEELGEDGLPMVWKLIKSLYGLRQAGRNWYHDFKGTLTGLGWERSQCHPCIFTLRNTSGELRGILLEWVDDCPCAMDPDAFSELVGALQKVYKLTHGKLEWCLGVKVIQSTDRIELNQSQYITDILTRFQMTDCKPAAVPMEPGALYTLKDSPKTQGEKEQMLVQPYSQFKSLLGALMYASVGTRPDISLAVSKAGHVMSNPGSVHWRLLLQILRYLKGTKDLGIVFTKLDKTTPSTLTGSADSDFAACVDSRRSTSGFAFHVNGGPVAWKSKLQGAVALSTTESEYIALAAAGTEAVWLRQLMEDFGFKQADPTVIMEDNYGCIQLTKDAVQHTRTKHIDIRHHKLRELVAAQTLSIQQCPTEHMVADILTKPLPKARFQMLRGRLMGHTPASQ